MKHVLAKFSALFVIGCLFLLSACRDGEKKNLVVGSSIDYPPFAFYQDGKMSGFEIALTEKIAGLLGLSYEIKDLSFDSLIGALQSKRIDIAVSAISATDKRRETVEFSVPYHHSATVIVFTPEQPVAKLEDLRGLDVGVQMGTVYEQDLEKTVKPLVGDLRVCARAKVPELLQALANKQIRALCLGIAEAKAILDKHPEYGMFVLEGSQVDYAIALPKGSELLPKINEALRKLQDEGILQQLEDTYLHRITDETSETGKDHKSTTAGKPAAIPAQNTGSHAPVTQTA